MYPTSNVLHRVFNLRVRTNGENCISGTMFAVDVDGRRYFVTARHIGKHIGSNGIQVMRNGDWVSYPAELVGHGSGKVDVSVMALPDSFIPNEPRFPLPMGFSGATLGEEMMFLGFPVVNDPSKGFSLYNGFPLPLVKYARLSAIPTPNYPMWLDGHNNPGFSGSPLCFAPNKANELGKL